MLINIWKEKEKETEWTLLHTETEKETRGALWTAEEDSTTEETLKDITGTTETETETEVTEWTETEKGTTKRETLGKETGLNFRRTEKRQKGQKGSAKDVQRGQKETLVHLHLLQSRRLLPALLFTTQVLLLRLLHSMVLCAFRPT